MVLVVGCGITAAGGASAGAADATAATAAGAAGGGAGAHPGGGPASPAAFYRTSGPLPPAPPGAIVRSVVIPSAGLLPGGATAYRVLYHSQSIAGVDIAVSGVVVVPGGTPPPGGFPIVAWAHGTTGLSDQCAPSLGGFASIPSLTAFLDRGMIVAATDYEGLGTPGIHPYLVGQSEAQSVLDSARAARNLAGVTASNQVAVVGYSQGGQAALFAAQIAAAYSPELFVAGAVAAAPVTSLDEFVPAKPSSEHDLDAVYALMALDAWSRAYGNLPLSSVLTASTVRQAPAIATRCIDALAAPYDTADAGRLFRSGWESEPGLRTDVERNRPGQAPTSAPVLVVEGTKDQVTPYRVVTDFVAADLCRNQHDTVQYDSFAGTDHGGVFATAAPQILRWVTQRLSGAAPPDTCEVR